MIKVPHTGLAFTVVYHHSMMDIYNNAVHITRNIYNPTLDHFLSLIVFFYFGGGLWTDNIFWLRLHLVAN